MTYEYECVREECGKRFDVIKSVKDIDRNETCPVCGEFAARKFVPSRVFFSGTQVQHAEFNPALGCVVKDKYHRAELAKRKGLVEIGNDYGTKEPEKMHREFDQKREDTREERWKRCLDD